MPIETSSPPSTTGAETSTPSSEEWKQLYTQCRTIIDEGSSLINYLPDIQHHEELIDDMFFELRIELEQYLQVPVFDFFLELTTGKLYRVDEATRNLTEADLRDHADKILAADRKELSQFIKNNVFKKTHVSRLPSGANVVDCVWVRKWGRNGEIKSRLCARGCFDRQKQMIEKHSSTASRLSQRLVISQFMIDGIIYTDRSFSRLLRRISA